MTAPIPPAAQAAEHLSRQQRAALTLGVRPGIRLFRTRGGWGRLPHRVSLDVAASLVALGLMRVSYALRDPQLVITGNGKIVQAVLESRSTRRKAA